MDYHASTRKLARRFPSLIEELRQKGHGEAAEFLGNRLESWTKPCGDQGILGRNDRDNSVR
jgi:hypothetical protein